MTSTLTPVRRLSVRYGTSTADLAVPVGTRLAELLESGGFPPGSRLVDASGASLPDDDRVGDVVEDGALLYVVDAAHTPSLTRLTPAAPARGTVAPPGTSPRSPEPGAPAPTPDGTAPSTTHMAIDAAAAGARTRSATRRGARGRPGITPPVTPAGTAGPSAAGSRDPGTTAPTGTAPGPDAGGRRAVVPPTVRRPPGAAAGDAGRVALPPPPGPTRTPVPLPPGRSAGRGAPAGRHGAATDDDRSRPAQRAGAADAGDPAAGTARRVDPAPDLAPVRRTGAAVVPPPPRIAAPPSGATGRGALATRAGHRAEGSGTEPRRRLPRGPAEVSLSAGTLAVPMILAAAAVLLVVLANSSTPLPTWATWTSGAVLLLAAVVAAVRPGVSARRRFARIAAVTAGGCGGFLLAVSLHVHLDVSAVCGLLVASAVAMLGRVAAIREGVFDPWVTVAAVGTGAVALDAALAIALSWPAYVGPLLLAGVSPLVLRALPALSLDVPEEQLVDTERLSNTSWSARTGVRRRRRPLRQATVELITLRASGIVAAGTVAVALFVTCGYGLAVLSTMPGAVARWALLAEGVLLLGGLGLAARTVRDRFGKALLRLTAAVVALETGLLATRRFGEGADVVLVVLLVLVALGVVGVSLALDVGWRSLRLSRIADVVEGFCVVFALPAALLAVDVIAVLRQAAS